jgi:hypothetical protein
MTRREEASKRIFECNPVRILAIDKATNLNGNFVLLRISRRNSYDDARVQRESFLTDFSSSHHWEIV